MSGPGLSSEISWAELEAIAPTRTAGAEDSVAGLPVQRVLEPTSPEQVAAALEWANAARVAVTPRGGATKLGWGNRPRAADLVLSTKALNRILDHAWEDMTATVEAGCTVADLQRRLAEHGQRLALDCLWPERATIGGILATNDSGSLRVRFGSLRDLVIGATIVLPDGTLARSGGRVVKNVAGYDLQKLMTGALGTLGIITQAIFRLHPLPPLAHTLSFAAPDAAAATQLALDIQDSILTPTGIQIRVAPGAPAQVDVRFEGIPAAIDAQSQYLLGLAHSEPVPSPDEVWRAREELISNPAAAGAGVGVIVAKFSVLPTEIGGACESIQRVSSEGGCAWRAVIQGTGIGMLRIEGAAEQLPPCVIGIRSPLEAGGGSLVVLECPLPIKHLIDSWGSCGDSLPLMRRLKDQFDPTGILNPGRFVGGI